MFLDQLSWAVAIMRGRYGRSWHATLGMSFAMQEEMALPGGDGASSIGAHSSAMSTTSSISNRAAPGQGSMPDLTESSMSSMSSSQASLPSLV